MKNVSVELIKSKSFLGNLSKNKSDDDYWNEKNITAEEKSFGVLDVEPESHDVRILSFSMFIMLD